jgi:hypothetical protein
LISQNARPFAKPWKIEEQGESFQIGDAARGTLANVYCEDEPTRRNFSKRLSKDDARRMAQQILRLPELVRIANGIEPSDAWGRGVIKPSGVGIGHPKPVIRDALTAPGSHRGLFVSSSQKLAADHK